MVLSVIVGFNTYRPDLSTADCDDYVKAIMQRCWSELPEHRPELHEIMETLKPLYVNLM